MGGSAHRLHDHSSGLDGLAQARKPEEIRLERIHRTVLRGTVRLSVLASGLESSSLVLRLGLALVLVFGPPNQLASAFASKAFLLSLGYGFFNELIQAFIPQRFPSAGDLAMNAFGVVLGIYCHVLLLQN